MIQFIIDFIVKCYFGAWHNFYNKEWPVRFLVEWTIFLLLLFLTVVILRFLAKKYKLKNLLVSGWCIGIREIVYFLGHEKEWAVTADNRMIDWAHNKMKKKGDRKKHHLLKGAFVFIAVIIYFLAVFVDLPIADHISEAHLSSANPITAFFMQIEARLSKGYEQYPPLFVQTEEYDETAVIETSAEEEENKPVFIQLNDSGKDGSNIRSEPSLGSNVKIIGVVNKDSEILYGDKWTYDGKRYWIWVYIPANNIEGWLSGNLVDIEQLNEIVESKID